MSRLIQGLLLEKCHIVLLGTMLGLNVETKQSLRGSTDFSIQSFTVWVTSSCLLTTARHPPFILLISIVLSAHSS